MTKRKLIHAIALVVTLPLVGAMLTSRLSGQAGHLTDLAITILVAGAVWHALSLRRIALHHEGNQP